MPVPIAIPIVREAGYHTDQIGTHAGGQFMGFVTATLPVPTPADWSSHRRWYAVLHTFDAEGRHMQTDAVFMGTTADGEQDVVHRAERQLAKMIASLGEITYADVKVGLFQVNVEGSVFGLVDASEPEEGYESIHLLPNDLAFFAPWDGTYDT
jgi:formate hydrogenlyase regulatory protein HycA